MKKIWCLLVAALLVSGSLPLALAEDYTGGNGWHVAFDGDSMDSNFTTGEISDAIYAIQPGDSVTVNLDLENDSDIPTDWYMTNEVLQSLEDNKEVASSGGYTYILTYIDSAGAENVLFTSENIGGEKESGAGEGLHEATDNLSEFFYLDSLDPGQAGAISLYVALDGETQGNSYQDTLAELQMNFAVERSTETPDRNGGNDDDDDDNNNGGNRNGDNNNRQPGRNRVTSAVQTSDSSRMFFWSTIGLVSGLILLVLALLSLRRDKGGRKHEE